MRAWTGPTRVARRRWSWLPRTQLGQAPAGSSDSYSRMRAAILSGVPLGLDEVEVEGHVGSRGGPVPHCWRCWGRSRSRRRGRGGGR